MTWVISNKQVKQANKSHSTVDSLAVKKLDPGAFYYLGSMCLVGGIGSSSRRGSYQILVRLLWEVIF